MNETAANTEESFDVVIVGCGPGGSVLGARLRQKGLRVLAIEKEAFPRFHIGESLTGTVRGVMEDLGLCQAMDDLQFPSKSGVKVIGKDAQSEFFVPVLNDTWQVRRADFDKMLLDKAIEEGMEHRAGRVTEILRDGKKVVGVRYQPNDASEPERTVRARFVADCTGRTALLSGKGIAGKRQPDRFCRQLATFTHVENAVRDPGSMGNNTFIFYSEPYHWAWFIPISPEVVSIGIVLPKERHKQVGRTPDDVYAWGVENINPDLRARLADTRQVEPVRVISDYSYRIEPYAGDGWVCVGDAHRFADPIFSFGVAFAMHEAYAAANAIDESVRTGDWELPMARYTKYCDTAQDVVHDFIHYFWQYPTFFGYQMRGKLRKEVIRLFAGDCYQPEDLRVVKLIRERLESAA